VGRLVEHWPVAGLVIRTARLELRWPDDDDLVALAELAALGIHDPDDMPFGFPWTRAPQSELERNLIQWHWRTRGEWTPARWSWNPVVVVDGEIVGTQGMGADDFVLRRTVSTGSWLGRKHQGHGIGTEMRAAMLHLAFAGLRALRAETGAWDDNAASLGVNRKLGYRPNGDHLHVVEDRARRQLSFVLHREDWEQQVRDHIEIEGLAPCLVLLGAADPAPGTESSHPSRDG
jgi:RimJ/RimL family protein N-acetyltransferase